MKCPYCLEDIQEGAIKCKHCGEILKKEAYEQVTHEATKVIRDYSALPPYYQKRFPQFDKSAGGFQPSWNWAAFCFGIFWYLEKGMWQKGVIILLAIVFMAPLGGIGLFFWLYYAIAGNYDYYLFTVKGKQLW